MLLTLIKKRSLLNIEPIMLRQKPNAMLLHVRIIERTVKRYCFVAVHIVPQMLKQYERNCIVMKRPTVQNDAPRHGPLTQQIWTKNALKIAHSTKNAVRNSGQKLVLPGCRILNSSEQSLAPITLPIHKKYAITQKPAALVNKVR